MLPPAGTRMLAAPDALDVVAWAGVLPLATIAGALAGAAIHGRVIVEPLGVRRRERPAAPGRANLAGLVGGIVLVLAGLVAFPLIAADGGGGELLLLIVAIAGLLIVGFTSGPRLALAYARMLERRGGVVFLLALRRLQADPRSAGRAAGVLFVCGVALGVEARLLGDQLVDAGSGSGFVTDTAFYATGYGMTAVVLLVAAGVALLTLLVGAADGLLDARRPLATLAALGVDARMLERVVAQQLSATAVPAIAAGACVAPAISLIAVPDGAIALRVLVPAVITALVAALAMAVAARLAARVLRPVIRGAVDPENLRVA